MQVNDRLLRFQSHANDAVSGASSVRRLGARARARYALTAARTRVAQAHASHIRELLSVEKQVRCARARDLVIS